MLMNDQEERFEEYLRKFQPVMPRGLATPVRHSVPWGALAVAAAMLVVLGVGALRKNLSPILRPTEPIRAARTAAVRREPPVIRPVTAGQLNAALHGNDQDFDQVLNDAGIRMLPREHPGTALYELSKE